MNLSLLHGFFSTWFHPSYMMFSSTKIHFLQELHVKVFRFHCYSWIFFTSLFFHGRKLTKLFTPVLRPRNCSGVTFRFTGVFSLLVHGTEMKVSRWREHCPLSVFLILDCPRRLWTFCCYLFSLLKGSFDLWSGGLRCFHRIDLTPFLVLMPGKKKVSSILIWSGTAFEK